MIKVLAIAIDGPSGAGKSTIAKDLAKVLDIEYIDTGAMYRALGYKIMKEKISLEDHSALKEMLAKTHINFSKGHIILDGEMVDEEIRRPEVSQFASKVSAIPQVREKLVTLQRNMGASKDVIMDGRDIGTNVLTEAPFKFFITASVEERATRRWKELVAGGEEVTLEEVKKDITKRDHNDTTRALNPLRKAADALEIDTTRMAREEVINKILEVIKNGSSEAF